MSELLAALVFSLVIGAQFLAVVAVHRRNQNGLASSADVGKGADVLSVASVERT
jgi:hypothetical protein